MPRRKQEQPKRLPSHGARREEVGEASEEENWFGTNSETPSEDSFGDVQENFKLSPTNRGRESPTSPDTSLGSATPSLNADLGFFENEVFKDVSHCKEQLSTSASSVDEDDQAGVNKPLSSNLRRLLEAGSVQLGSEVSTNGREDTQGLQFSPSSHHAKQLSVLARKLAEKQENSDQYGAAPASRFIWSQDKWLQNSNNTCGLSPDSAILKLKAAANAVLQDQSQMRTEETLRFETFTSPFSSQSASSTLAALSKKVSERGMTSGQERHSSAGPFLSLASMTSSAALLKEVAARAAGSMLAEKKKPHISEDPLPLPEDKQEKGTTVQSLELLLLPSPKGRTSKSGSQAPEEEVGKPFQCPICGLVIKRKSYWKRHMVIHTGLKSHQCPLCPFRCARKDNLKSHMKVHQHQDRGETFQCQLCPFTSSRHFSLKLHMRCHQHFLRAEAKVKEEPSDPDNKGSPFNNSLGSHDEGSASPAQSSQLPENLSQISSSAVSSLPIKEEPKDNDCPSMMPFPDRPSSNSSMKLKDALDFVTCPSSLFSQDISVKMASDFLMKLSAESCKDAQTVKIKEEPMEVDIPDSSVSPRQNIGYSTLLRQEKNEHLQKMPECRVIPEGNLFSQDISVKMASELLFKLSEKVSKESNHNKSNIIRTSSPFFSEDKFRQSPFTSKDLPKNDASLQGRPSLPDTEILGLDAGSGIAAWKLNEQLFPCDVCGKVFGRQQTLSRHLLLHTEERKYKCHLCPYAAKCRANLNQHLTVHAVKLVSTDTEDIVSAVICDANEKKKNPYYYSCHVCGFETELNVQFVSHMSLHVDKEQWMYSICCSACDFVTMEEVDMRTHVSAKHSGDERKTPSESISPSSSSLSALSDSANSKEDSDTPLRNQTSNSLLVISVGHSSQPFVSSEEKSDKGFECVFCNFVCKTKPMFERHLQIHLITRMYECDVCHKFMKTPEQLVEHKKCHTVPTGGLKCPFCIYSTNRPAAIECHLKTHYKMEYKCRICKTVKANQLELEVHIREHRLGNHYKCDQCGYLSKTANKLIEHVRVHTGERPFHCDQCSYSCKRKDNLNLHKKLKHSPRQTFSCEECLFKTTHPFVFSRHVKKHQNGEFLEEEKKTQTTNQKEATLLLPVNDTRSLLSPLSVMSASQALQTVAMSAAQSSGMETHLALKAFAVNGNLSCLDRYQNSEFAHLIPLTMLFPKNHYEVTFHPPRPQTAPPGVTTPKHSFLAYLGLTERAKTV
ncbi:zinc finger protein 827 isoform X2 [Bufo gargarizans]|uniref:zinc finger protein 827 isoform X2 n=1 Tax=Bufo gargarizans TaxID=30331 RepID=UPI001CF34D50|nr:zinc finger protein 827 isoform X2 [Bufo gargarizans]